MLSGVQGAAPGCTCYSSSMPATAARRVAEQELTPLPPRELMLWHILCCATGPFFPQSPHQRLSPDKLPAPQTAVLFSLHTQLSFPYPTAVYETDRYSKRKYSLTFLHCFKVKGS